MALGYIRAQLLRNSHGSLLLISCLKSPCVTQTGLLLRYDNMTKANTLADSSIRRGVGSTMTGKGI